MPEAKVRITADIAAFIKAMKEAQEAMAASFEKMKGSVESFTAAFEKINVVMASFTAVLSGGAAFKEFVSSTVEATVGAVGLGRELGITTTQASILRVAMDATHVPMEAVAAAANKIATQIKKNPEEFTRFGVAIRNSDGTMRDSLEIMLDVNEKLAAMHDGTARNVEGQRIYGKSWESVAPTIRLTREAMEEATETAERLHLIVGKEGVERTSAYREAMVKVHEEFEGVSKTIGDLVLPMLTAAANKFTEMGNAVDLVRTVIGDVVAVFARLGAIIEIIDIVEKSWMMFIPLVASGAEAIGKAMHLDFDGARATWDKGLDNLATDTMDRMRAIKNAWADATKTISDSQANLKAPETPTDDKGGKNTVDEDNAGKSRMQQWENELAQKKVIFQAEADAKGQLVEFSKQQEIDYWTKVLATTRTSSEEKKSILSKILADELAIDKQRLEGSLGALKNEETAAGKNLEARLAAEMKYADAVKNVYGADSKAYDDAQKAIIATKLQAAEQVRKIDEIQNAVNRDAQLGNIALAESEAKEQYDLKQISLAQLIALQEKYENQRLQISMRAAMDNLNAMKEADDPVAYATQLAKLQQIATQHNAQMLKIDQQANQQQIALAKSLESALASGMASAFEGIIKKTETVHQAFTKMMEGMLNAVVSSVAKMIAQWIAQHAISMLLNREQAIANAGTAASGAMASAAAIPYIGWILAPIEGAAVYAQAIAFGEQGYDIPSGVNPLTQLHQEEMVLPAKYANPLRENLESGGGAGGGGRAINMNINAVDSRSFEKAMKRNSTLNKAIKDLHRRMAR